MFRPCLNRPSSGWIKCPRNYTPTLNTVISDSVSTEKGGDEIRLQKAGRVCVYIGDGNQIHVLTKLNNNGHTMLTWLIHVFGSHHRCTHMSYFL